MQRRDEIDAKLAKHFAWSFVPPDKTAVVAEQLRAAETAESERPGPPPSQRAELPPIDSTQAKLREAGRALAHAIADTWSMTGDEALERAVKRLLVRADRLGFDLLVLQHWPVEAVRLLRLFVRHGARWTRRQRERASRVASLLPIDHPEIAELLVEMARAGDRTMAAAIFSDDDFAPEVGDEQALIARLADVVDAGPTHASRV